MTDFDEIVQNEHLKMKDDSSEKWGKYKTHQGKRTGANTPRMTVAMPEDAYEYIKRESYKRGMTYGQYIYTIAKAVVENGIEID